MPLRKQLTCLGAAGLCLDWVPGRGDTVDRLRPGPSISRKETTLSRHEGSDETSQETGTLKQSPALPRAGQGEERRVTNV